MEKFGLLHIALYARGWYKRYNNKRTIWDDLKVIMSLDGYSGEVMDNRDIVGVMLAQCQKLDVRPFKDLGMFADGISRENCWRYGYFTNEHTMFKRRENEVLAEYNYGEAIVRYCLSNLRNIESKEIVDRMPKPDYNKGLPRPNGVSNKKIEKIFGR